ncbi:MAG: Tad domain-containing protein [bacterium]
MLNKKGSILVLACIFLVSCTAVFSYVVDLGRMQLIRHRLYIAADMASLAGATRIDWDEWREPTEPHECTIVSADPDDDDRADICFFPNVKLIDSGDINQTACGYANVILNKNDFRAVTAGDKHEGGGGGSLWVNQKSFSVENFDPTNIKAPSTGDCVIDNGDPEDYKGSRLYSTITVSVRKEVESFFFEGIMNPVTVGVKTKAVVFAAEVQ